MENFLSDGNGIFAERATLSDIKDIASIESACFEDAWSESAIGSHLESACTLTLVARDGEGHTLGYISASLLSPEAEIYRVATLPEHRRRRIGSLLLAAFIDTCEKEGCEHLFLEVRESNTAAKALYFSHGFCEIGRRKNYYKNPKEDALILAKDIERV